jgi:hypothetical protein
MSSISERFKRILGLATLIGGGLNYYFWEFLRSMFYDRIIRFVDEVPNMIGTYLTWDSVLRLTVSLAFAGVGVALFWKTRSKEQPRIATSPDIETLAARFDGTIEQIRLTVKSDHQQADIRFRMVSTAVRARDTIGVLKEADILVSSLGPGLIAASETDYPDWKKWNTDYAPWRDGFQKIDNAMNQWKEWTEYSNPFLGLRQRDYERASNLMPPVHIISDVIDMSTSYKNVCLINPRWEQEREQIFKFLKSKADTLPG